MKEALLDLLKQAERKVEELTELRKALYNNAKAKSKEFRKDRGEIEMTAAQFKRQQLEKSRNAYKKAKENGTIKVLQG